jgi:hypothetical protein
MNAFTMPLNTPAGSSMGRVSVSRAACGRRCGRAFSALQNLPLCGTRHQINEHMNDCERQQKRVSQLSQSHQVGMGQKNPMKSTLSQLSQLSQSKNTDPEANTPTKTRPNQPESWRFGVWGTPPRHWVPVGLFPHGLCAPREKASGQFQE